MSDTRNIPDYLQVKDLDQEELSNIFAGSTITENLDDSGNQIIDMGTTDAQNNISVIKQNITIFSPDKIEQNYSTTFDEFLTETEEDDSLMVEDDIKQLSDDQLKRESVLSNQLDELSKILEIESQKNIKLQEDAESNYKAMKSVIIEQRIQNKEGESEDDFQDAFPFLPKNSPSSENTYNPLPYASEPT